MRIQLLNPPVWYYTGAHYRMMPPLNLPILAAVFGQAGHYAETVDLEALEVHPDRLEAAYREQRASWPDVIGMTALTITARGAKDSIAAIRRAGFTGKIVVGGIYATQNSQTVLDWGADLVVTGECEGNVVDLFVSASGIHAGQRADINDIPAPDWLHHNPPIHTYWGNTALVRPAPGIAMWTRGCPYNCVFCSNQIFNHQGPRRRRPDLIEAEMRELQRRGCQNVYVYDDELVGTKLPAGWMGEIADRLEPLKLPWITQGRCSKRFITPDLMRDMKRAGCHVVFWGIESFSQNVLNAIRKHTTEDDIWHTLRVTRDAGIENAVFTMIGNYKETPADLDYTAACLQRAYAEGLIQYRQTTVCTGMPGTPLEQIMRDEGWWVDPPDAGPQMGQVFTGTPWLTADEIKHYLGVFAQVCPVGVPA